MITLKVSDSPLGTYPFHLRFVFNCIPLHVVGRPICVSYSRLICVPNGNVEVTQYPLVLASSLACHAQTPRVNCVSERHCVPNFREVDVTVVGADSQFLCVLLCHNSQEQLRLSLVNRMHLLQQKVRQVVSRPSARFTCVSPGSPPPRPQALAGLGLVTDGTQTQRNLSNVLHFKTFQAPQRNCYGKDTER